MTSEQWQVVEYERNKYCKGVRRMKGAKVSIDRQRLLQFRKKKNSNFILRQYGTYEEFSPDPNYRNVLLKMR